MNCKVQNRHLFRGGLRKEKQGRSWRAVGRISKGCSSPGGKARTIMYKDPKNKGAGKGAGHSRNWGRDGAVWYL